MLNKYKSILTKGLVSYFNESIGGGHDFMNKNEKVEKKFDDLLNGKSAVTLSKDDLVTIIYESSDFNLTNTSDAKAKVAREFLKKLAGSDNVLQDSETPSWYKLAEKAAFLKVKNEVKKLEVYKDTKDELAALNSFIQENNLPLNNQTQTARSAIVDEAKAKVEDVKKTVILERKYKKEEKTLEENTIFSNTFSGSNTRREYIKGLDGKSRESLSKILFNSSNLKSLYNELSSLMPSPKKNGEIELTPTNNDKVSDKLKELGYIFDNYFESPEIMAVFLTIRDYVTNQDNFKNLPQVEQLKLMFDFDQNGIIESDINFRYGEAQLLAMAKDNKGKLQLFMDNLGMGHYQELATRNLYSAREQFKEKLALSRYNPVVLFRTGGKEAYDREINSLISEDEKKIDEAIKSSPILASKLEKLNGRDDLKVKVINAIKSVSIGVVVGDHNGVGLSFDVSKLTNKIIDSVSIGTFDGVPGFSIAKNIIKGNNGSITLGLVNFVPFVSATGKIDFTNIDDLEAIQGKIDGTGVNLTGNVSATGMLVMTSIMIGLTKETNSAGINKLKESYSGVLDRYLKKIKEGKNFENTNNLTGENLRLTQEAYTQMKSTYDEFIKNSPNASDKSKDEVIKSIKDLYLNFYSYKLGEKNAGNINITGIGASFVNGLIVPIIGLEKIWGNKWEREQVGTNVVSANLNVTGKKIDLATFAIEKLDGELKIDSEGNKYILTDIDFSSVTEELKSIGINIKEEDGKTRIDGNLWKIAGLVVDYRGDSKVMIFDFSGVEDKDAVQKVLDAKKKKNISEVAKILGGSIEGTGIRLNNNVLNDKTFVAELQKLGINTSNGVLSGDLLNIVSYEKKGNIETFKIIKDSKIYTIKAEKFETPIEAEILKPENIDINDKQKLERLSPTIELIEQKLNISSIKNSSIANLQRLIFSYKNGEAYKLAKGKNGKTKIDFNDLDKIWTEVLKVFGGKSKIDKSINNGIKDITDAGEKHIIMDAIMNALMKDLGMKNKTYESVDEKSRIDERLLVLDKDKNIDKRTRKEVDRLLKLSEYSISNLKSWEKLLNKADNDSEREYVYAKMPLGYLDQIIIPGNKNSRAKVFESKINNEFGNVGVSHAREKWYNNANAYSRTSYETDYITDGSLIAFSASAQIDKAGIRGVTPMSGVVEVMTGASGNPLFESLQKTSSVVDKMPKYILFQIGELLTTAGVTNMNTETAIKDFIKSGGEQNGVNVDFDLVYFKMGKCGNDAIGIKDLRIIKKGEGGKEIKYNITVNSEGVVQPEGGISAGETGSSFTPDQSTTSGVMAYFNEKPNKPNTQNPEPEDPVNSGGDQGDAGDINNGGGGDI